MSERVKALVLSGCQYPCCCKQDDADEDDGLRRKEDAVIGGETAQRIGKVSSLEEVSNEAKKSFQEAREEVRNFTR